MTEAPTRRRGRPHTPQDLDVLLDGALSQFARYGFEQVSMRGLAKELGVSYSLFHHHFGSKQALWQAVVDRDGQALFAEAEKMFVQDEGEMDEIETLKRWVRGFVLVGAEHTELIQMLNHERAYPGPRMDFIVETYLGPVITHQREVLQRAQDKKLIRNMPEELFFMLVAACASPFTDTALMKLITGDKGKSKAYIDSMATAAVDLLFNGLILREND